MNEHQIGIKHDPWWKRIVVTVLRLFFATVGVVLVWTWLHNLLSPGSLTCTVTGTEFVAGRKYSSHYIKTSDCGVLYISSTRYPEYMSKAELSYFLGNNKDKKFEFITNKISFGEVIAVQGISSTTPVE